MTSGLDTDFTRECLHLIEIYGSMCDIIWLVDEIAHIENDARDMNINEELHAYLGLQNIQQRLHKYHNVRECIDRLRELNGRSVILFISRNVPLDEADYSLICDLPQVEYIYDFGSDVPCRKIRGEIFTNLDHLSQAQSNLHIIPPDLQTASIENFDDETKKCFIMQLLLELLQQLTYTEREKDIFIEFLLNDQRAERPLQTSQHQRDLLERSAIWLYTGDSQVPRFVNKILRQGNPVSMIKIHYFIHELYSELKALYNSQLSNRLKSEKRAYRGKVITVEELHRFQKAVKKLVLTNSFVSASEDREVALIFSGNGQSQKKEKVSVLFVMIIAACDAPSKPMAFVDQYAAPDFENELLLSSGRIFRIDSVKKVEKNFWEIVLVRDLDEMKFEKELYAALWTQINLMNPFLSIEYLLQQVTGSDLVDEYSRRMADLLETNVPEVFSQLRMRTNTCSASTTHGTERYMLAGQTIVASSHPVQEWSLWNRTRNRLTNLRNILDGFFSSCFDSHTVIIIIVAFLVIIIITLIVTLSIVFTIRALVAIVNAGSASGSNPNCVCI